MHKHDKRKTIDVKSVLSGEDADGERMQFQDKTLDTII